jgi:hypothetical protein
MSDTIQISGQLLYDPPHFTKLHERQADWKKVVIIKTDDETDLYYAWFLKKRFGLLLNPSGRGSHVTIVCEPVNLELYENSKLLLNGTIANFNLHLNYKTNCKHWWLSVSSDDAISIRNSIGLITPRAVGLHLTLGFAYDLQLSQQTKTNIEFFNI